MRDIEVVNKHWPGKVVEMNLYQRKNMGMDEILNGE